MRDEEEAGMGKRSGEEKVLSRRRFLAKGAAFTFAAAVTGPGLTLLSGCGGDEGGGGGANLRWSMWADSPAEKEVWQQLANRVTDVHPDIKVTLETYTFTNYWDKLQTQLASETQADIVAMQALRMPGFAVRNALQPLQPLMEDDADFDFNDFFPVIEKGLSFGNEVYALSYDLGPPVLFYNKDRFKEADVPTPSPTEPMTWEQFRDTAAALTNAQENQYGYVQDPTWDWIVPWLWSGGGDYMNAAATECTLDSPESIAALEFIVGLFTKDKVAAPITDLANPNSGQEAFFSGNVGMHLNGIWQSINVQESSDFDWDIVPLPAGEAGSVGWVNGSGFGVSSATEYTEQAWQALKVITSTESLKSLVEAGRGYPGRKSAVAAFESPELPPPNDTMVQKVLNGDIGEVRPYRVTTNWQETDLMLTQRFIPVLLGQKSVRGAVADTVPKFDELLQEHQETVS